MNKVAKSRKDRYVAKGNDLVEAKRSMHLTTRERKLVAYMVSCISPYDDDFKEYRYTAGKKSDGSGAELDEFIAFAIKIVMQGTNSAEAPRIKDLRCIALAT